MPHARPSGHAVQNGRMIYTSVSQIKRFDAREEGGCERRWWFRYVAHLPEPQTAAQQAGEDVHAQLEHYLKTGEDVLGPIARAGKHLLPEPNPVRKAKGLPELLIESPLEGHLDAAGVNMIGFIDLVVPAWQAEPLEIADHKSSSNISRYAKTGPALATDTQMIGYAEWGRRRFQLPDNTLIRIAHNYYQTKGAQYADKRHTLVSLNAVRAQWQSGVEPIVERMKSAAGEKEYKTVKANEDACYSYGKPCPYLKFCNNDPVARLSMSLLNKLRGGSPASSPPPPAPTPSAPTPAQVAQPVIAPNGAVIQPAAQTINGPRYSAQQQQAFDVDELGIPLKRMPPVDDKTNGWKPGDPKESAKILPDDAPKSDPELAAECEACAKGGKAGQQHKVADCPTLKAASAPPPEPKKRGPGRPRKYGITPGPAAAAGENPAPGATTSPPASAGPDQGSETKPIPAAGVPLGTTPGGGVVTDLSGFDLYVDAIPSIPFVDLAKYVAELHDEVIVKAAGVPDVALVEFGKGKGLMRAAATAHPPSGVCVIRRSDLTEPVIEALKPLARLVVQGVR